MDVAFPIAFSASKTVSDELATLFGTTSRKVASTLAMAISKGRLIRVNQGGKFRYCIPGDNLPAEPKAASVAETDGKAFPQPAGVALPVQEAATQEDIKTETVADIVQSLLIAIANVEATLRDVVPNNVASSSAVCGPRCSIVAVKSLSEIFATVAVVVSSGSSAGAGCSC